MRTTLAAAAAVALLGVGISACSPSAQSTDPPAVVEQAPVAEFENDDAASNSGNAVDDVAAEPAPKPTVVKPKPARVKVPSVVGMNLQLAEHKLEQKGFTNILPLPVDGHAFVANPANWVVVGQDPASGKRMGKSAEFTLEVAKTDEAENSVCLDGDC